MTPSGWTRNRRRSADQRGRAQLGFCPYQTGPQVPDSQALLTLGVPTGPKPETAYGITAPTKIVTV
jgi:hypothetical protein